MKHRPEPPPKVGTSGVRAHLGLQIPPMCAVRVGANALTWREGQWTLFNGALVEMLGLKHEKMAL